MNNYFPVKNNLFNDPKHEKKLGNIVWLYLYLLSYSNADFPERKKVTFYMNTYCKKFEKDKELVKSELKLLEFEGYIVLKYTDGNIYFLEINKPIKIEKCL